LAALQGGLNAPMFLRCSCLTYTDFEHQLEITNFSVSCGRPLGCSTKRTDITLAADFKQQHKKKVLSWRKKSKWSALWTTDSISARPSADQVREEL